MCCSIFSTVIGLFQQVYNAEMASTGPWREMLSISMLCYEAVNLSSETRNHLIKNPGLNLLPFGSGFMSTGAALSIRSPPPRLLVSRTGGAGGLSSSLDISSGGYRFSPWSSSSLSPDWSWLLFPPNTGRQKRPPERFAALLSHET